MCDPQPALFYLSDFKKAECQRWVTRLEERRHNNEQVDREQ
ncbi:hypothetical protein ABID08_004534 [Rhizobium binae]|uniref:PH domain-containing protein n=1 Tax=Rhizobium binae TaxID=1138190 RepID=A0ABV2MP49_9HYPH